MENENQGDYSASDPLSAYPTNDTVYEVQKKIDSDAEWVERPWGSYVKIWEDANYAVKVLLIRPDEMLSLQVHQHRDEQWMVTQGSGIITRGEHVDSLKKIVGREGQTFTVKKGIIHRIENVGVIDLHIVEIQTGSFIGENDIYRYDDKYGR